LSGLCYYLIMDPETKKMLQRLISLTEDNNRILHVLHRAHRFSIAFHVLKWIVIIGGAIGLYYFLQPVMEQFLEVYAGLGNFIQAPAGIFDSFQENFSR